MNDAKQKCAAPVAIRGRRNQKGSSDMTSITAKQHTALLDALDALRDKHVAAAARGDLESEAYFDQQYRVIRDLVGNATTEAGDAK